MVMSNQDKQQMFKLIGLYAIILLTVFRFLIYPLSGAVQSAKILLADEYRNYQTKKQLMAKFAQSSEARPDAGAPDIASRLYGKDIPVAAIQAEVLELLLKKAELHVIAVQNYEMPDTGGGNVVGVVPVVIRAKGATEGFIEFLKDIQKEKKALVVQSMEVRGSGNEAQYNLTIAAFRFVK